jgi:deoxyribose-phosphate aldolase
MKDEDQLIKEVEGKAKSMEISPADLAKMIDHTLLQPNKTSEDFTKLCEEARAYGFHSVCVNPYWVPFCVEKLGGTTVKVISVVGFPLGQNCTEIKALEAKKIVDEKASEIDMVMNIAALKGQNYNHGRNDIGTVVKAVGGIPVKVILETGYLTDEEIVKACEIAKEAGAAFVKTSTGFGPSGATIPHVSLMRKTVGKDFGVKASGGIRNFMDALKMIAAGANRIGSSTSVEIIEGLKRARGDS